LRYVYTYCPTDSVEDEQSVNCTQSPVAPIGRHKN